MTLAEHLAANAQYASETAETALVQVLDPQERWADYSRTTPEQALAFAARRPSVYRVVDWITREMIEP